MKTVVFRKEKAAMHKTVERVLVTLFIFALSMSADAVDEQNLKGYWTANEGSGSTVADVVGGLDGTLMVGPGWEGTPHDAGWGDGIRGEPS